MKENWQKSTIWSFPDHGKWATHNSNYRGNWSPYVPRNLIKKYSNPHDIVLDQFVGSGTTLIEAQLLNRTSIGIDINDKALKITKSKLSFSSPTHAKIYLRKGDAKKLEFIPNASIDLICTHPPYANIIKYSNHIKGDLSLVKPEEFKYELKKVASESYRVLKSGKFCTIMIGDVRKNGKLYPLGFQLLQTFQESGFVLKEIIIKEQHNCKGTKKWANKELPFLLLAHEYVFVFKK